MHTVTQRTAPPSSLSRRGRRARRALAVVLALLLGAWLVLFVTHGRFLRHPAERLAGAALHRPVRIAGDFQFWFAPLDLRVVADGLVIGNPAWARRPVFFRADHLAATVAPLSLLWGRRHLRDLAVVNGFADLEWDAAHRRNSWTFGDPDRPGPPAPRPRIDRATLAGTSLRYTDDRLRVDARVRFATLASADARIGAALRFAGEGTVRGTPFTSAGALLSPDATVAGGENRLRVRFRAARNVVDAAGTLPDLATIEGVPLAVRARGRDLDDLLGIIGVAVPRTRAYRLAGTLTQVGDQYRLTDLTGRFGDSDLAGSLTVTASEPRTHVAADLVTRRLDIVDAAAVIGYNPDLVAAGSVAAAGGAAPGRILPDTPLDLAALAGFDADVRYRVGRVASRNVPISDAVAVVSLHDRLLRLAPLDLTLARGSLRSQVTIDARRRPVHTSYDVRLLPTPLGRLLAGFGVVEAGTTGTIHGRIRLEGDGDTLHRSLATARGRIALVLPAGTFWTRNVQLAELDLGVFAQKLLQRELKEPVRINCGLVGFTVRDGRATADPVLIDTAKNVITARGGFSFGTEAVDLAVRADAKTFSLFSGQSPVGLGGHFASPAIHPVSRQLLARAGAAVGLGLVATPVAAALAFVDPGDARAAACGPVLAGATASHQRDTKGRPRTDVGAGGGAARPKKKFLGLF